MGRTWRPSRFARAGLIACCVFAGNLSSAAWSDDPHGARARAGPEATAEARSVQRGRETRRSRRLLSRADRRSFARLTRRLGGSSGLTASNIGRRPAIERLGDLRGGVAWSTIKVVIALAAIDRRGPANKGALIRRAITASDNAAAEELWNSLGPPASASAAIERQLRAAGDRRTQVPTRRGRPGFSVYGQTQWRLVSQQRFIAGLPCLPGSSRGLALMRDVIPAQRWGLGSSGRPAAFKGGWSPDPAGRYLVRQMGLLSVSNSRSVAVTLATKPGDGRLETGGANLTRIARWLVTHLDRRAVGGPRC